VVVGIQKVDRIGRESEEQKDANQMVTKKGKELTNEYKIHDDSRKTERWIDYWWRPVRRPPVGVGTTSC